MTTNTDPRIEACLKCRAKVVAILTNQNVRFECGREMHIPTHSNYPTALGVDTDHPDCLRNQLDAVTEECRVLRDALEFYAEEEHWWNSDKPIFLSKATGYGRWQVARAALDPPKGAPTDGD